MTRSRIPKSVGLALLCILALLPGSSDARLWIGAQIGANFAANTDVDVNEGGTLTTFQSVKVEPSVIGGLTLGYDFVREGFLGYNWPDWMKYFSFATDFTFNRFDMREQFVTTVREGEVEMRFFPTRNSGDEPTGTRVEGTMAVWSLLFIGKYGFFPDSDVPFGRLQPYVAVGPGIMFSSLQGKFMGENLGSDSSVDIALITEAGVRYMALKNVSLDVAFRYRFGSPKYSYQVEGEPLTVKLDANQFTALFRAAYHF